MKPRKLKTATPEQFPYRVFAKECALHNIPKRATGFVVYHYWDSDLQNDRFPMPHLAIERLKADIKSGSILRKRGFGVKTLAELKKALGV